MKRYKKIKYIYKTIHHYNIYLGIKKMQFRILHTLFAFFYFVFTQKSMINKVNSLFNSEYTHCVYR